MKEIGEKMKVHTARRMKIEPCPWLREYLVDMENLYTKLTLNEIKHTIFGETIETISEYKQMFETNSRNESSLQENSKNEISQRNKILIKGDPWTGKTTLLKKMTFDWASGFLDEYFIVFFVALKLVHRNESIETAIIQQNPELVGLEVFEQKLQRFLERFGHMCLLILDGFGENVLDEHKDILEIIKNQKWLNCGLVLSSRPHCTKEIENYFPTIIRVDGFSKQEAEEFVFKLFPDKEDIKSQIIQFKPSGLREDFPIYKCPILLSVLCALIKGKKIDLSDSNTCLGDLYLQIVQFLYKEFTIRKGKQFVTKNFVTDMKKIGQLALVTLASDNHLLLRSEVIKIVGTSAFEYGFFTGHEDFSLFAHPTADIRVCFVHISIEEFFWAFGFLQALDDGKSVEDILGSDHEEPNSLILGFCLWLLKTDFFKSSENIFDKLASKEWGKITSHRIKKKRK